MKKSLSCCFIIFAAILLVLAGCTDQSPAVADGSVRISVRDSISKGIAPGISMNTSYFIINGEYGSFDSVSDVRIEPGETRTFESLTSGTWTFSAIAYNADGIAIGRSNSTEVQVLPGKTVNASLIVYEEAGNGTFTVKLDVDDMLNTYALYIYKLIDGVVTEVGEAIAFTESEGNLVASAELERGFYAFSIDCSNGMIKLPPIDTVRILAGDSVSVTYDIIDTGDLSVSFDNTVSNTPAVTISIADGIATASVSDMGDGNLTYTWYADRTELEASGSSVDISGLSGYETITCVVQNTSSDIIWSCTEEL